MKKASENRRESYTPDLDSIKLGALVPPTNEWASRRAILQPLMGQSMCALQRALRGRRGSAATLGVVKPRSIDRLVIRRDNPQWSPADLERLLQQPLMGKAPREPLEKMPVKFTYWYHCEDAQCQGHKHRCTDWEMCETYRSWISQYGKEDGERRFRVRFFDEMVERNDTQFFVGTHSLYPTWMVVGLFYPPKTAQPVML